MAKKSKCKPRKPSGPNPFYPTRSVLKKIACLLEAALEHQLDTLGPSETGDPEVAAFLDAMRKRGSL